MRQWIRLCGAIILLLLNSVTPASDRPVIVLLSDDTASYRAPLKVFMEKIQRPVMTYNLKGNIDDAPATMQQILQRNPALILALGAKAAWASKLGVRERPDIAVVFAMVLNHQRYHLDDGQVNIAGISADIAPGTQLFNLNLISPAVKRIGVIYSPEHSAEALVKARNAAGLLGLEIVSEPVHHAREFGRAWRKISSNIDAFWVLNDPVIYTLDNIYWIKERCIREQIICTGQSDNISRLGVLLAINPDSDSIGAQASAIARDILDYNRTPAEIGIVDPIGTRLTLNESTARKIGLNIGEQARAIVTDVISR